LSTTTITNLETIDMTNSNVDSLTMIGDISTTGITEVNGTNASTNTIIFEGMESADTIDISSITFNNVTATINGLDDDDIITGSSSNDVIDGGAGNDTIDGGAGDDTITIDGDDTSIKGGDGTDTVILTANADFTDADTDVFEAVEVIDMNGGDYTIKLTTAQLRVLQRLLEIKVIL